MGLELPIVLNNSWYMPKTRGGEGRGKRLILIETIKLAFLQRSNSCPVTKVTMS